MFQKDLLYSVLGKDQSHLSRSKGTETRESNQEPITYLEGEYQLVGKPVGFLGSRSMFYAKVGVSIFVLSFSRLNSTVKMLNMPISYW